MKAMIFAAGLGTRLGYLTKNIPKALIPVSGKPLLQWVVEKLINSGVTRIIINVHHHPTTIRNYVARFNYPGVDFLISDETHELLDTGGGLKLAHNLLYGSEPIILHNVDILSNVNIDEIVLKHKQEQALATLAVSKRTSSRQFLWDDNRLAGWQNLDTGEKIISEGFENKPLKALAFSGIHIIDPIIFRLLNETGPFSITNAYLRLASKHKIVPFEHEPENWIDVGTPGKLKKAEQMVKYKPEIFH